MTNRTTPEPHTFIDLTTEALDLTHAFMAKNRLLPETVMLAASVIMAAVCDFDEEQRVDALHRIADEAFINPELMTAVREHFRMLMRNTH